MFKEILPTGSTRNMWRTVRRVCMLILGLKGLTETVQPNCTEDNLLQHVELKYTWAGEGDMDCLFVIL